MGPGSETKLQVGENLNKISCFNDVGVKKITKNICINSISRWGLGGLGYF